jgi:hypothetical protein
MRAKAGLIPVVVVLLMALTGAGLSVDSARAEEKENCLAAPNGKPPEGSHWHYRTDPATQTKCWYLRPAGETAQKAAAQELKQDKPAPPAAVRSSAIAPKAAHDQAAAAAPQPRPVQAAHAASGGGPTPQSAPAAWPDPPAGAANVTWPDPARLAAGVAPQAPGPQVLPGMAQQQPTGAAPQAAETPAPASQQQEPAAPAPNPNQAHATSAANDSQAAAPAGTTVSDTDQMPSDQMPLGLLGALAISLLVAGIFIRRIVKALFARRVKIAPQRREPVLNADEAAAPHHDGAEPDWVERLDGDVQAALRNLLRTLERQAA